MKLQVSLKTLLLIPLVLQLGLTAALISLVGYRNDIGTSDALAAREQQILSQRVQEYLRSYLSTPQRVIRLMASEVASGRLDLNDRVATTRYLWELHQLFPDAPYLNYGLANGNFIGLGQVDNSDRVPFLEVADAHSIQQLMQYRLDREGRASQLAKSKSFADFRSDGWYATPRQAGRPVWTPIYNWVDAPEIMAMGAGTPILRNGRLLGVAGVDVFLANISRYLHSLPISRSGMIFVVESDGLLVADASDRLPFTIQSGKGQRHHAIEAGDPMVRRTALALVSHYGSFENLNRSHLLRLPLSSGSAMVRLDPYKDSAGLNWRIVVVIPEFDINGQLRQRALSQLLASLSLILLSAALSLLLIRFVVQRLEQLVRSSDAIAEGDLSQHVAPGPIRELALVAESFNAMADRLRRSFKTLRARNREMRRLVTESTKELAMRQQEFRQAADPSATGSPQGNSDPARQIFMVDALTGLLSREGLRRRWERLALDGQPLTLVELMISITSGGAARVPPADERITSQITPILMKLADAPSDLLAHDGSGCFYLLLPGRSETDAIILLQRLREQLAGPDPGEAGPALRIHGGIATVEAGADSPSQQRLWERAREALLLASLQREECWRVAD